MRKKWKFNYHFHFKSRFNIYFHLATSLLPRVHILEKHSELVKFDKLKNVDWFVWNNIFDTFYRSDFVYPKIKFIFVCLIFSSDSDRTGLYTVAEDIFDREYLRETGCLIIQLLPPSSFSFYTFYYLPRWSVQRFLFWQK